jgi:hypothetical protein
MACPLQAPPRTPASRGARTSISPETSVPKIREELSFGNTGDYPVPQATLRATVTGSRSSRKSPIFSITDGWQQGKLLTHRSAGFRESK